ncbi:MAG TPA: EF-hand domain-containing protein [Casimicrobiaceae bacterium]|nr:EF-hand domain-containing protein [Casimicrobiaceae bacterium]
MNFRANFASALASVGLALAAIPAGAATPATDSMLAQASNGNSTTTPPPTTGAPSTSAAPSSTAASSNGASPTSSTAGANTNTATDAEARKVFDELDTNHDGTLSFDEFKRATIRPK